MSIKVSNAYFYAFKPSGKWKYSGRGYLAPDVFQVYAEGEKVERILRDNGNTWPGMSTAGSDLTLVVIPDDNCDHGWPLMFVREKWT